MTPPRFIITLQPEGAHAAPAVVRLRQLLKVALRVFKLRCVDVKDGTRKRYGRPGAHVVIEGDDSAGEEEVA